MKIVSALCYSALCLAAAGGGVGDKYAAAAKAKWEGAIKKFEMLDKRSDYAADSILFMGSSSIRLWETLGRDMAPYPVIQRGYGGAKFSDLAVFAKRIVHPHDFRAVVIFVANDIVGKKGDLSSEEVVLLYEDGAPLKAGWYSGSGMLGGETPLPRVTRRLCRRACGWSGAFCLRRPGG